MSALSDPTARTPHRAIWVSLCLSHLCFQVSQGIALYPLQQFAISQPRGGGNKGYRSSSCPLEGIALYGRIAEIVSPIAA